MSLKPEKNIKSLEKICEYAEEDPWYTDVYYCGYCDDRDNPCLKSKDSRSWNSCGLYKMLKRQEEIKEEK